MPIRVQFIDRQKIIQRLVRGFNSVFEDIDTLQVEEMMYRALKAYKPSMLKMTRIAIEEEVPAKEMQRLGELETENATLRALLAGEEDDTPPQPEGDLQQLIREAIVRGLEKDNAQMVGQALEYVQELEGKEFLTNLQIEIVPFTIKDTSLEEIILRAPEEIVVKCEAALRKRRLQGASDPAVALAWEREWEKEKVGV